LAGTGHHEIEIIETGIEFLEDLFPALEKDRLVGAQVEERCAVSCQQKKTGGREVLVVRLAEKARIEFTDMEMVGKNVMTKNQRKGDLIFTFPVGYEVFDPVPFPDE